MAEAARQASAGEIGAWAMFMYRFSRWFKSPTPYMMLAGFVLFFGAWFLLSEVFKVWRFASLPGPRVVLIEWLNKNPVYGMSLYTPDYYIHIWSSLRRVLYAFLISTGLGVPFGLFLGWSRSFKEFTFPVFEMLRPIPVLAWVPLAIVMFKGDETPIIFLTTLASFYATALNTMLGVQSIDESYPRAAACLGASKWQVFRHVIIPGALPFIFTGLQISVGVAWFSLVAGEMVSGEYGLGYLILSSYVNVQYVVIIIGMISVGIVGYASSALVRLAGDYLMQWRVRELALGGTMNAAQEAHAAKGAIRIENVDKVYHAREGAVQAVSDCSLDIRPGEICMIVGPSGCGKTTLLNAIAGFHDITGGAIYLDGEMLCGPERPKAEPGPDRVVVFQNGALFPWKTNLENVAFGPVVQGKLTQKEAAEKARGMMADAGLVGVEHNYPGEVSSGMRRRVEIVRALMNDPKVLLLDEPFRALDQLTKSVMHEALLEIYYKNKVTIFFITHDLEEAIFLGHRVAIMTTRPCKPKKILEVDIPHPRNYGVLTSPRFRELMEQTVSAVHEEAVKAFEAGEKEM